MNLLEGGWGREGGGERMGRGRGGEREGGWGDWRGDCRGGEEGSEGGRGEGGMTVIHILIGMFNSNPMIPQY